MAEPDRPVYRLVAYEPFGDALGVLPYWTQFSYVDTFCQDGTLTMEYPARLPLPTVEGGQDWLDTPGIEWLAGEHEIRVEKYDVDQDNWDEVQNGRLRLSKETRDPATTTQLRTYTYTGIMSLTHRYPVRIPDPTLQADGDEKPQRVFLDATWGEIYNTFLDEAHADGYLLGIETTFGPVNDSNGEPWPVVAKVVFPVETTLHAVADQGVAEGHWEIAVINGDFRAYVPRTFLYRDLTDTDDAPVVRYGQGVTAAPTEIDYDNMYDTVLMLAERGRLIEVNNPGATGPWGPLMRVVSASGTDDADVLDAIADEALRVGHNRAEQVRREIDGTTAEFFPYEHFRTGDLVPFQRGTGADGEFQNANLRLQQIGITVDGTGQRWFLTGGDRRTRLLEWAAARLARLTGAADGGHLGPVAKPGIDERIPTAPTNIVATPELFLNQAGKSRVRFAVTVTTAATTINPDTLVVEDLNLGSVDLFYMKTSGTFKRVLSWEDPTATVLVDNQGAGFDPDETHHFKAKARSHSGVKSDLSADFTATQAADVDPVEGPTQVRDARFQNAVIRAARVAGSGGAGLSFALVSGQYRARLTNTNTLDTAIAETATAGQRQVTPLETYLITIKAKRSGGTSVNVRGTVRWYDAAGATISSDVAFTTATTTSDVVYSGTVTAPATAVRAAARYTGTSFTGGPTLEMSEPTFDRRTSEPRMEDNSASTRVYITDSITEPKQAAGSTSTRVLADLAATTGKIDNLAIITGKIADLAVQTAKLDNLAVIEGKLASLSVTNGKLGNFAVTNGKIGDAANDGRTVAADAIDTVHIAANVDILGVITTGSGLTLGGTSAQDIDFPSGGHLGNIGGGNVLFGMGTAEFSGNGTYLSTWTAVSTRESKKEIKPLSIEKAKALLDLDPVTFRHKDEWVRERTKRVIEAHEVTDRATGKKRRQRRRVIPGLTDPRQHVGLIAEDVAAAGLDEVVGRDADGKPAGIDYGLLTPYLLRLLQDHEKRISELEATVRRLST